MARSSLSSRNTTRSPGREKRSPGSACARPWARSSSRWSRAVTSGQTRWWWIRHAPVPDGGKIYGQSDLDCDCTDGEIFSVLARELPHDAVWITSNLARTHQTAAAILQAAVDGRHAAAKPIAIPELAEQHLGEWQGMERKPFYAQRKVGTH